MEISSIVEQICSTRDISLLESINKDELRNVLIQILQFFPQIEDVSKKLTLFLSIHRLIIPNDLCTYGYGEFLIKFLFHDISELYSQKESCFFISDLIGICFSLNLFNDIYLFKFIKELSQEKETKPLRVLLKLQILNNLGNGRKQFLPTKCVTNLYKSACKEFVKKHSAEAYIEIIHGICNGPEIEGKKESIDFISTKIIEYEDVVWDEFWNNVNTYCELEIRTEYAYKGLEVIDAMIGGQIAAKPASRIFALILNSDCEFDVKDLLFKSVLFYENGDELEEIEEFIYSTCNSQLEEITQFIEECSSDIDCSGKVWVMIHILTGMLKENAGALLNIMNPDDILDFIINTKTSVENLNEEFYSLILELSKYFFWVDIEKIKALIEIYLTELIESPEDAKQSQIAACFNTLSVLGTNEVFSIFLEGLQNERLKATPDYYMLIIRLIEKIHFNDTDAAQLLGIVETCSNLSELRIKFELCWALFVNSRFSPTIAQAFVETHEEYIQYLEEFDQEMLEKYCLMTSKALDIFGEGSPLNVPFNEIFELSRTKLDVGTFFSTRKAVFQLLARNPEADKAEIVNEIDKMLKSDWTIPGIHIFAEFLNDSNAFTFSNEIVEMKVYGGLQNALETSINLFRKKDTIGAAILPEPRPEKIIESISSLFDAFSKNTSCGYYEMILAGFLMKQNIEGIEEIDATFAEIDSEFDELPLIFTQIAANYGFSCRDVEELSPANSCILARNILLGRQEINEEIASFAVSNFDEQNPGILSLLMISASKMENVEEAFPLIEKVTNLWPLKFGSQLIMDTFRAVLEVHGSDQRVAACISAAVCRGEMIGEKINNMGVFYEDVHQLFIEISELHPLSAELLNESYSESISQLLS